MSSTTPPEALRRIEECRTTRNTKLDLSKCELTEVPSELADLIWLENLNLSINQISEIKNLGQLTALTELELYSNRIGEIKNLEVLTKLTRLILDNNQISEIENLDSLKNLVELDLSFNQISEIKNLVQQTVLVELYLHVNKIVEIKNLDQLTVLRKLHLSSNKIGEITNLNQLTFLTDLHLRSNQISEIKNLDRLTVLTSLDLSVNKISEIKNLDKLNMLSDLDFFGNRISEIKNLNQLTLLTSINFSSNQISEIENLDCLIKLTDLDFYENDISEIKNLDELSELRHLFIASNQISEIKNLDKLSKLTHLSLAKNQIREIKNLDKLIKLTDLELNRNQINEIKGLDVLKKLTVLSLYRNKIRSLSGLSISLMRKIEEIDLSDNPIRGTTITDWKNPKAILGYLESQQDTLVDNYYLKVNIIGEGRIGKTQLFKYWNKQRYKENQDPTHGTLTTTLSIPGSNYKAIIWDFGGQAYHHGFHHVFLRPNDFYLVLWRNTPDRNPDYGYWLGTARNFSRPSKQDYLAPVVLVQNVWTETDIPEQGITHQPDSIIFPDSQKMQKYGVQLNDVFTIDVKQLRLKAGPWKVRHNYFESSVYQKMIEHAQNLLPKVSEKWLKVKERLDENPIKEINLTKETFHRQHAPDFDEAALAGLLDYLEFAGNIIKFPEPSSLSNYVFPDPPKLSAWIYGTVLNKKMLENNKGIGIIKYSSIQEKEGEDEAEIFLGIMEEFNLLFAEKGNDNNLVIPQFLPENNNSFKRLILELIPYSFCLRFADFFHESRIFQFISEYGMYADDETSYWRYGLVFTVDEVNALVYYNVEKRIVFVHLENKKGRTTIAQDIFDYFTKIQRKHDESGKRLSYYARRYNVSISAIVAFLKEHELKVELNPNVKLPLEAESLLEKGFSKKKSNHLPMKFVVHTYEFSEYIKPLLLGSKRNKINPEELIEGVQLSTNQETYIEIKETLQNNTDDFPVGICVESRKRIKLDNLTLNLLGMVNQKLPKVFISYSRKDLEYKDELKTHLSILERYDLLKAWSCEEIEAGTWDSQIQTELEEADVIVYMVSQNFMASGYIMEQEVAKGLKMAQENPEKKIICVLVRNCLWKRWSFMEERFKDVLEKDGKEIFSKDLSKYQFLPYHQYKNQEGIAVREEIVALEEWGRYPYHVSSVAFTQVADRILTEVTRRN